MRRTMFLLILAFLFTTAVLLAPTPSKADEIRIDMVAVRNAGNRPDSTGYGAVGYDYQIGMYEVTAGQYTAFLNAVAKADPYGLYDRDMWTQNYGCKIDRGGPPGSYAYSVAEDRANRPVNYVSWGDAARFTNWLHNGQGNVSTETGAYTLNGAMGHAELMAITRDADARYWIPTENEWYKAAYHKNDGVTGNYWDYPTSSDMFPSKNLINPDPGNNANIYSTIGGPYYRTEVGEFENSDSPYGTFDQGGNLREWNETDVTYMGSSRGERGGHWDSDYVVLLASRRTNGFSPEGEDPYTGFRVASVPEPAGIWLMLCGGLAGLYWWRRRK